MAKAAPFSMRLSDLTDQLVAEEAQHHDVRAADAERRATSKARHSDERFDGLA